MTIKVYIGTRTDTESLETKRGIIYPEITVEPEHIYSTLKQISINMKSNNIDVMEIITLSPIVLNATETLASKESCGLQWYECKDGNKRPCIIHEKAYKKFAHALQGLENIQWADED